MKLVIIRHADPDYVHDSITEKGWREAELLSKRVEKMNADYFYCSPLGRAKDTASLSLKLVNKSATELPWLHEFKGSIKNGILKKQVCWDRLPAHWTNVDDFYDYNKWDSADCMKSQNVQSENQIVKNGIDELLLKHGYRHNSRYFDVVNSNHDTIVLFCHFGVEAIIMAHIFGVSPMPFLHNFCALPTSVTTLVTEEREKGIASFRCIGFGDVSHLYCGGEEPSFQARFCECFSDDTRH